MSGLAHYLEDEGIATVAIALIRKHAEEMRPPRALAVPFELGRPFGAPDEPDFQRRVVTAAFDLLAREAGPVLEDFPEAPPGAAAEEQHGWACPVNFAAPVDETNDVELVRTALEREIVLLRPWYEESQRNRKGRTAYGISGRTPEEIAAFLAETVVNRTEAPNPFPDLPFVAGFKRMADDIRIFYTEAAIARPGTKANDVALAEWMYGETTLGKVLIEIRNWMMESDDKMMKTIATTTIVPSLQRHRTKHG